MVNMNQGDLFNLIVKLNFSKQIGIVRAIISSTDLDLDEKDLQSCVNRAYNNKKPGGKPFLNIIGNMSSNKFVDSFFSIVFKDCDLSNGATPEIIKLKYAEIKEYLNLHALVFNGMTDLNNTSATCEQFVKRMILEAFQRHEMHTDNTLVNAPIVISKESESHAKLHAQTIFCPNSFLGRDGYLSQMRDIMKTYKLVILCGIGGIGKTYLSRQYAHQYASNYSCEQIVTYDKKLRSISQTVLALEFDGLNDIDMSDNDKLEKRMSLLKSMSEDTLLIIDNVDSKPLDKNYFDDLRTNSSMHIIVTTRLKGYFPSEQTIQVLPMTLDEQIHFFKKHYKDFLYESDLPIIKDILKYIDGHTLLIELVAKSMYASAFSPAEMLEYLKGDKVDAELVPIEITKDNLSSEKKTMDDFVKLLFDVGYLNETSKEALLYLSLLPIEGVGRRFYYNLMPKFKADFNELTENSWAIQENNVIRLHPIIKDMVKHELKPSSQNCLHILQNLHSLLQSQRENISNDEQIYICRILQSINDIDDFYKNFDNIPMLTDYADFCYKAYHFTLALDLYKKIVKIAEFGPVQTMTNIQLSIGNVYKRLALLQDAITSYNNALKSNNRQPNCAEKDLQDADIYLLLSDTYRKDGQYDLALESSDIALDLYIKNSADPLKLAEIYNRRGIIYLNRSSIHNISESDKKKYLEDALSFYKKGLNLRIENHDNERQLAYSYHNIGTAYNKLGSYELAKQNHENALNLRLHCKDTPPTDIASSYLWIGEDYMALGYTFMELAKDSFEKSLKIRENILGRSHPEVAWSLISLSQWYKQTGDLTNAQECAERAYRIRKEKYAPTHEYVLAAQKLLELLLQERNN